MARPDLLKLRSIGQNDYRVLVALLQCDYRDLTKVRDLEDAS